MSRKKVGVLTCIGGIDDPAKLFSIRKCVDTVIGTDLSKIAIGQNFVDIFIPEFTPQKFIDEIIYTFSEENDYYFFVGADEEALILSQIKNKFDHIHILLSNHKDLKKVLNKHLLYSELKNHDLPFPNYKLVKTLKDIYKALDDLDYGRNKIVVKPLFGRGGRGIYFLEKNRPTDMFLSKSETLPIESFVIMLKENKYIAKNKLKRPLIFCEYLSGDAWSVDYLSYDGELICAIPKKKISGNA